MSVVIRLSRRISLLRVCVLSVLFSQGEKDWQKYEVARSLKLKVDSIRRQYQQDWSSREMKTRQRGVALYFIDKVRRRRWRVRGMKVACVLVALQWVVSLAGHPGDPCAVLVRLTSGQWLPPLYSRRWGAGVNTDAWEGLNTDLLGRSFLYIAKH